MTTNTMIDEQIYKELDRVRSDSLRSGAQMIAGIILGMINESGTDTSRLDKIYAFCKTVTGSGEQYESI